MPSKHLLILGGYGNTGFPLARLLLAHSDCRLTLAGRNLAKARQAAERLNTEVPGNRVRAACVDALHPSSLRRALQNVDMVVVASSTAEYVENVARTALECNTDYFDVQYAQAKMECLQSLVGEIERFGGSKPSPPRRMKPCSS